MPTVYAAATTSAPTTCVTASQSLIWVAGGMGVIIATPMRYAPTHHAGSSAPEARAKDCYAGDPHVIAAVTWVIASGTSAGPVD